MIIIANKVALSDHLDNDPSLAELREALGDEWPDVRRELLLQVWRMPVRPPAYGTDWSAWLNEHLDEAADEAVSIVL